MEQANQGSRYSIPSAPEINTTDDYLFLYRTPLAVEMKSSQGNVVCIFQKAIIATCADKNIWENTINFQIWGRLREAEVKRDRSVGQRAEQHVQSDLWPARWRAQDGMLSLSTASSLSSFFYLFIFPCWDDSISLAKTDRCICSHGSFHLASSSCPASDM